MVTKYRFLNLFIVLSLVLSFASYSSALAAPPVYVIDHFDTSTETIDVTWASSPGTPITNSANVDDGNVLGGEREIVATVTGGINGEHLVVTTNNAGNSVANAAGGSSLLYTVDFIYDGPNGTVGVDPTGLSVTNLTNIGGKTNNEFFVGINSMDQLGSISILVYSNATSCSIVSLATIGKVYDSSHKIVEVPFTDFTTKCSGALTNATFTSVRAVVLRVTASGGNAGLDINIHSFGLAEPPFTDTGDLPDSTVGTGYDYNLYYDPSGAAIGEIGPRHVIEGPTFGATITAEGDQQPDQNAALDVDDGVVISNYWATGPNGGFFDITINGCNPGPCYLSGFIDWDGSRSFYSGNPADFYTDERILVDHPIANGVTRVYFNVPNSASIINSFYYVRLRLENETTSGFASPWGDTYSGEVQDYLVSFNATAVSLTSMQARTSSNPTPWLLLSAGFLVLVGSISAGFVGVLKLKNRQR